MVCKRVFIQGKVQGVGFRFHAHEKASALNLTGWVKNLADGRVEILVAGKPNSVEEMIEWARKGPSAAKVTDVEVLDVKDESPKEPFFINREGN